jgi:Concanavalin A-like lectin/glucanases superfamily
MSLGFLSRRSTQDGKWTTPANSLAYDTWNHVAVVYDSSSTLNNPNLYINGVKQTISTITSPLGTQTLNEGTGIIGNRIPLDQGWDGLIDEFRVYKRALSASEVVSLYDQGNSGPFNFSLANSMNMSVTQGSSATNSITASLVSGSPQPVSFSISGLPQGTTGSFSKTTCTATCSSLLTIATAASTPAGTYTITVTGTGEDVTKTTSFTLTVNSSTAFNFSLSNDGNKSVTEGQSIASTITATLSSGSSQAVSFSTSGLPSGATASYATSTSCNPTCSRTLNIATAASTPTGTYTITVTGATGEINKTTSFSLTVTSTASTAIISPAQGTALAPGQSVTATGSGTNLSWDIDLIGDGLSSFKTGTGSSITFTVPSSATSSQIVRITLTGSGGSVTRDYNVVVTSSSPPPFDFSLSNSGNTSVTAGSSVANTISATLVSGSTQPIVFSVTGLPAGTTAGFSPASCGPTCSATITINASGSAPPGSSTITVTATGGEIVKTTAFGLTVTSPPTAPSAQITLIWQDNSNNEDNFEVERKTGTTGTYSQTTMTAMNAASYVDTSVTRGATYCYRVRAVNSAGASAYTNEACRAVP